MQRPVHPRAGQARAGAARQLLSPRRRAHRVRPERRRRLEGHRQPRRAVLPLPRARRALTGLARTGRRRRCPHGRVHRRRESRAPQRPRPGRHPCTKPLGTKRSARQPPYRRARLTRPAQRLAPAIPGHPAAPPEAPRLQVAVVATLGIRSPSRRADVLRR